MLSSQSVYVRLLSDNLFTLCDIASAGRRQRTSAPERSDCASSPNALLFPDTAKAGFREWRLEGYIADRLACSNSQEM